MSGAIADPHREIEAMYAAWVDAFRRKDVERILSLVTDDYLLWAPGAPALVGRDALRPMLTKALASSDIVPAFELEERLVTGDLAVDRGWDVQTVRSADGAADRTMRQRVILVLRRAPSGAWQFARGMSQPGPAPAAGTPGAS